MAESLPVLSALEQRFVEEYAKDRNAVRAALEVGLSTDYFPAANAAARLLKTDKIRTAVKAILKTQAKRLKCEVPDIVREWAILGKSDLTDYVVDEEGNVTTRPGVPKSALRAVKRVKTTRTERLQGRGDSQVLTVEFRTEIELHAKDGPLSKIYEHLHGVLPNEHKVMISPEVATRILAEHGARESESGGSGDSAGPDAVVSESRPAEPGVSESRR